MFNTIGNKLNNKQQLRNISSNNLAKQILSSKNNSIPAELQNRNEVWAVEYEL